MKKSVDGGRSWGAFNDTIHSSFVHFYFFNEDTGLVIGNPGYDVLKTTDGGLNWTIRFSYAIPSNFSFPFNDSIGFMASSVPFGYPSMIYKTTNFGDSWTPVGSLSYTTLDSSTFEENYIERIFFVDYNVGFASSDGGRVYKTTNGGITWSETAFSNGENIEYIYFMDTQKGFILNSPMYLSSMGGLYRTDDGGNSWTMLATGSFKSSFKSMVMFDSIGYLCAGREIMKSTDRGLTWNTEWSSLHSLIDMSFVDEHTGFTLDYDSIFSRYSIYLRLGNPNADNFISHRNATPEVRVFQNPTLHCFELNFSNLPSGEQVSCHFFDMQGVCFGIDNFTFYDNQFPKSFCPDNDHSSTKIYLLLVQSPSFRKVIKVVK